MRMVLFPASVTQMLPATSTAMPAGALKRAMEFVPLALPADPARPATVVTTQLVPEGVILRIVLFVCATKRVAELFNAMATGPEKRAPLLVPSALPAVPARPAQVVTTQLVPTVVTFRIVLLYVSATYTLPALSTAAPYGVLKRALAFVPSLVPGKERPAPATIVTTQFVPCGVTFRIALL